MADSTPAQRNSSRTVAIAVVVLLIIIAIAGIVLAGRRTASPVQGTAAAVPDAPAGTTPQGRVEPTPRPDDVVFASASSRLPAEANDVISKFGEKVRVKGGIVRLSARYAAGADKAKDVELAKTRTAVVRHALESNGVKAAGLQVELIEMPKGALYGKDADSVELSLH